MPNLAFAKDPTYLPCTKCPPALFALQHWALENGCYYRVMLLIFVILLDLLRNCISGRLANPGNLIYCEKNFPSHFELCTTHPFINRRRLCNHELSDVPTGSNIWALSFSIGHQVPGYWHDWSGTKVFAQWISYCSCKCIERDRTFNAVVTCTTTWWDITRFEFFKSMEQIWRPVTRTEQTIWKLSESRRTHFSDIDRKHKVPEPRSYCISIPRGSNLMLEKLLIIFESLQAYLSICGVPSILLDICRQV